MENGLAAETRKREKKNLLPKPRKGQPKYKNLGAVYEIVLTVLQNVHRHTSFDNSLGEYAVDSDSLAFIFSRDEVRILERFANGKRLPAVCKSIVRKTLECLEPASGSCKRLCHENFVLSFSSEEYEDLSQSLEGFEK